jgi:hypothetical protein
VVAGACAGAGAEAGAEAGAGLPPPLPPALLKMPPLSSATAASAAAAPFAAYVCGHNTAAGTQVQCTRFSAQSADRRPTGALMAICAAQGCMQKQLWLNPKGLTVN